MASLSLLILLLGLVPLAWTQRPEPWTITSYFEDYLWTDYLTMTTTTQLPVTPTADEPRAITTTTSTEKYAPGLVFHNVLLERGQGPVNTEYPYPVSTTNYAYNVVLDLTLPTGCTYTDSTGYVPASTHLTQSIRMAENLDLAGVVTPVEATTAVVEQKRIWRLDPTDIPEPIFDETKQIAAPRLYTRCENSYYHFDGNYSRCAEWKWQPLGDTLGGGFKCSNGIFHTWGLRTWSLVLAIVMPWLSFFLALGLWQNFRRFKRLMTGHESRRGLPLAWTCLVPIVGFLLACFRRDGFSALSPHEREDLTKKWNAMPLTRKLKLWLRYGFTYGYPPMLGTPPPPRTHVPAVGRAAGGDPGGGRRGQVNESGFELVPPPYTRVPTPRTSTDTPPQRPDPTLPPQEPPAYERREESPQELPPETTSRDATRGEVP